MLHLSLSIVPCCHLIHSCLVCPTPRWVQCYKGNFSRRAALISHVPVLLCHDWKPVIEMSQQWISAHDRSLTVTCKCLICWSGELIVPLLLWFLQIPRNILLDVPRKGVRLDTSLCIAIGLSGFFLCMLQPLAASSIFAWLFPLVHS